MPKLVVSTSSLSETRGDRLSYERNAYTCFSLKIKSTKNINQQGYTLPLCEYLDAGTFKPYFLSSVTVLNGTSLNNM
jgi:hypothetical protein